MTEPNVSFASNYTTIETVPQPKQSSSDAFRVCFVCTGNICRSPMAEIVFRHIVDVAGLSGEVEVSSRGTGDWHVGEKADSRTLTALTARGYDGHSHRARQMDLNDFTNNDLIVALDRTHLRVLGTLAPTPEELDKVELLMIFASRSGDQLDVPDPYYSDDAMFSQVLHTVEAACAALFHQLEPAIRQRDITA
ncbi:low molecular weight protein-tyrosine-phosphatase [Klugiella xanthotipulae]|uniref:protein-tyrosine-phosphatase n=1 Tax=Klugiella xanthotipulae TaxID=244735 RepID=A0A543I6Q5_9MICO|nr:protein-tyrosine phosphatase [Klugiella xanthotipulae]